jgi:hypothetical protein
VHFEKGLEMEEARQVPMHFSLPKSTHPSFVIILDVVTDDDFFRSAS